VQATPIGYPSPRRYSLQRLRPGIHSLGQSPVLPLDGTPNGVTFCMPPRCSLLDRKKLLTRKPPCCAPNAANESRGPTPLKIDRYQERGPPVNSSCGLSRKFPGRQRFRSLRPNLLLAGRTFVRLSSAKGSSSTITTSAPSPNGCQVFMRTSSAQMGTPSAIPAKTTPHESGSGQFELGSFF